MISEVLSRVETRTQLFRDVGYEWEEEAAKYFNVPIRQVTATSSLPKAPTMLDIVKRKLKHLVGNIILPLPSMKKIYKDTRRPPLKQDISQPISLYFTMFVWELSLCLDSNCIPIFCDVWSRSDFEELIRRTRRLKLYYVTSRDVYNRIKALSPSSNVHYMPLSIADKYYSEGFASYRHKTIDVLHSSRINPVLHEYMLRYIAEHGSVEYVYKQNGEYVSTTRGSLGRMGTRADYMRLIASAKVSLLGCSGIDNAREGTNGICFVTPRFYESAIMGCALIGRYPDNQEFTELNIRHVCPNITSYEQFCECLERALSQPLEELFAQNHDFIINSLTSKRAEQIQHDLEAMTCTNS